MNLVEAKMFWSVAYAQAAEGAAAQPTSWEGLLPIFAILLIGYFIMVRPQIKRQKEHVQFLEGIKRGDEVVTIGGLYGKVDGFNDSFVTLEVANNTKIKILKNKIASRLKEQQS